MLGKNRGNRGFWLAENICKSRIILLSHLTKVRFTLKLKLEISPRVLLAL